MTPAVVTQPIDAREPERTKPYTGEVKVQDLRVPAKSSETYADSELGSKRDIIIFSGMSREKSLPELLFRDIQRGNG